MSKKHDSLHAMRHSLAHIMAAAIQKLWPEAKFGVGPVTEDGFYYDVDVSQPLTLEDLGRINEEMQKIIEADIAFEQVDKDIDEAIAFEEERGQAYKAELLRDLKKHGTTSARDIKASELGIGSQKEAVEGVSYYRTGEFLDLCRGPHVISTGQAGAYRLTKVSGAYWRGSEENPQLQRVYGVAFESPEELDKHLELLAEAERRDHRKLGAELDIYTTSELVGAGLPLFTPKGTALINAMMDYVRALNRRYGYEEVRTGHITKTELYERSGHLDKFGEDVFWIETEGERLALKPMNCPHHTQLYGRDLRSYRDLPIKYSEFSTLHRNEIKGALGGLTRVRSLTMDDAHAFIREDQITETIEQVLHQVEELMRTYSLRYRVRLSLRDKNNPGAYLGSSETWEKSEKILEDLSSKFKLDYEKVEGEAAFYGPKMDFLATDALGREWQVSTIQLDFTLPDRFDLSYIDDQGDKQRPVMIHRALNGSFERMLGVLIEHYGGQFPLWLAPEQVRLATLNDSEELLGLARELADELTEGGIRVGIDSSSESVGKKIRLAEVLKVPYMLVIGPKEMESGQFSVRAKTGYGIADGQTMSRAELIKKIYDEVVHRAPTAE